MAIRVSDGATLRELLWLRHRALGNAEPSLPPADLPGDPIPSADNVAVGTWELLWKRSLDHLRRVQEADAMTIAEHPELWAVPEVSALSGRLGLDAATGAHEWRESLHANPNAERRVVDGTRRAWEAGLRTVIELPLRGAYARPLTRTTLLVSAATRRNDASYLEVLDAFARR